MDETPRSPLDTRLNDGCTLIEASAGSGKTRAITTLVARLVVEEARELDSILVVTFTKAATAELRDRIRKILKTIRDGIGNLAGTDDKQAKELLEKWGGAKEPGENQIKNRIERALLDIDRANIYTIHSFCQRSLAEFAFETGFPFGFEVAGDGAGIVESVVRDIWQRRFRDCPPMLANYVLQKKFMPAELAGWFGSLRSRLYSEIKSVSDPVIDPREAEDACRDVLKQTLKAWQDHGIEFCRILRGSDALNRRSYPLVTVDAQIESIKKVLAAGVLPVEISFLQELAAWLGGKRAADKCKKGREPPENPLFDAFDDLSDACAALLEAYDDTFRQIRRLLIEEAGQEISRLIRDERRLGYDDLLAEMRHALRSPAGKRLAASIRGRFPLALIDEFQDTDPMQEQIFDYIYESPEDSRSGAQSGQSEQNSALYIVGDPKQSIYKFRGADIFAYLTAQRGSNDSLQLGHNWRSAPELVAAVNAIFDVPLAFTIPEIAFRRAQPGGNKGAPLAIDGNNQTPFSCWLLDDQKSNDAANSIVVNETANEIIKLLDLARAGRATVAGRTLRASDIAILVPNRAQGREIAQALRRRGGKCVEIDDSSVFGTREAQQLHRLLLALANPGRQDFKRAALTGDLFGLDSKQLLALSEDDEPWNFWTRQFGQWRETWLSRGVGAMLRKIIDAGHGAENLMRYDDGPRRLTNLYHLTELLQEAETDNRLSPAGVVTWLSLRLAGQGEGDDAARLRIESDEDLVRVMTIHGSKGLEFPIVYLPFAWYGRQIKNDPDAPISYHFRDGGQFPAILDLAPDDASRYMRELEEFGESVRRLYVALTRARERCVVAWTRIEGRGNKELPALAWLLHRNRRHEELLGELTGESPAEDGPAVPRAIADAHQSIREDFRNMSREDFRADIDAVAAKCPQGIEIRELGDKAVAFESMQGEEPKISLDCREFSRPIRRVRQMTSFTALSTDHASATPAQQRIEPGAPDHDEGEGVRVEAPEQRRAEEQRPELSVFTFPRGITVGSCLHGIFESLDADPEREIAEVCAAQLARDNIDPQWNEVARAMIENTLTTQLQEPGQTSFRLAEITRRLTELEFFFPVNGLHRAALGNLLARHGYDGLLSTGRDTHTGKDTHAVAGKDTHAVAAQDTHAIDGFLRGFIDLSFEHEGRWYVLDYKSNWLGERAQDYEPESLGRAMSEHRYQLQYLIYLLALHRYLKTRLQDYDYDRHIGGAFYLFLRGMDPATGMRRGVFFDRPSLECIEALDRFMEDAGP